MGRLEVTCRRFAILSGVEQDPGDYAVCVHPGAPGLHRKGTLALITEPAGSYPSLAAEACRLTQRVVIESYFSDSALSLTSSLLNALDQANTALLQYNYSSPDLPGGGTNEAVAIQSGSVKPRRAKVGATALLIRPDGAGIYLSQMAPTQAYVLHNGMLSAIPEPVSWRQAPQHSLAVLSRAQGMGGAGLEGEEALEQLPETTLPAPSLGSGPGIEADLVYRRVEAGDIVVLVSTSLARHIDREQAKQTFSQSGADGVISTLYGVATDNGLAEAHACVLELGVTESSGVDEDYNVRAKTEQGKQVADNGGAMSGPQGPQRPAIPTFKEVLRGPRDWLQRRKLEPEQASDSTAHAPDSQVDPQAIASTPGEEEGQTWSQHPTLLFPQRPIDLPPYKAAQQSASSPQVAPDAWQEWKGNNEELQFDGWEDAPPALDDPRYDTSHKILFKPRSHDDEADEEPNILGEAITQEAESPHAADSYPPRSYEQPGLFEGGDFKDGRPAGSLRSRTSVHTGSKPDIRAMAGTAGSWVLTTTRSLLPDQISTGILRPRIAGAASGKTLPLRLVIAGALVIAGILFAYSVLNMAGNSQKAATRNLLQEAQQLETLANQPGLLAADHLQKLQLALGKAQEAATASPQSGEAKLLVTKLQNEIDQAQGITRFGSIRPLFDLDAIDKVGANGTASAGTAAQNPVSSTVPLAVNDIIVQSNDAFILDRATGRLYRCQIAAATCSAVLKAGDTAGGKQVSTIVAMTTRVGALVAIDDKLVSYLLSPDTTAWQAETLGDSDALHAPKDVATYDGNLYMLESRPGQISKYLSGQYGQSPIDWIQDEATIEAMKAPVAIAIDGEIYVALADGRIVTMQGGKLDKTIAPKATAGQSAPTRLFTNTDVRDLYLLRSEDGTITRISKEGSTISTLKAPGLDKISGMTVDEGKGKFYMMQGRKVFEATLAASPSTGASPANGNVAVPTQPAAAPPFRPTAVP